MDEASRLGKKGKSLTARRFSLSVWVIVGYGVELCAFDSFQCFYLFYFHFFLSFLPNCRLHCSLCCHRRNLSFSFPSMFFFSSIWDTGGAGDTRSMFVENEFVHQGAEKKHDLLYFMRYRGYGVRGHVAICFLYP